MPSAFRYYFSKAKSAAILLLALGGAVLVVYLSESYGKKPDEIETLLSDGLDFMWVRDSSPESSRIVGFAQCDDFFYCVYLVSWFSDREYRDASLAASFAKLASNWVPDL